MTSSNVVGCSIGRSAGLATLENLVDVQARVPEVCREARSIAQQASSLGKLSVGVDGRQTFFESERREPLSLVGEQRIRQQYERAGFQLADGCQRLFEVKLSHLHAGDVDA